MTTQLNRQALSRQALSRRALLQAGGAGLAALSLASCSLLETDPVEKNGSQGEIGGGDAAQAKEAPSLAAQVKAGKLPALAERLPAKPMIVKPLQENGVYGGTWHSAMIGQEDLTWLNGALGYEPLVRWKAEWTNAPGTEEVLPNVCESFKELEGGSVFEFTLRDGMRWSDGEPVTTEDFRFAFEDFNVMKEKHPYGIYSLWTNPSDETPALFETVDERTIRYRFKEPKPGFLNELCVGRIMLLPTHYLGTFHPSHNKSVEDLVKKEKFTDWLQLFDSKIADWMNPELPTLLPWSLEQPLGKGTAVTATRNPYYWKTDPDGRQLPYLDKVSCEVLQDPEVEVLKAVNGELDMQLGGIGTVRNKPVVARNREKGDYRMVTVGAKGVNALLIGFNQTTKDPARKKLYRDKQFRIGLSHAINRTKIIDSVYAGQAEPWQCAPLEGHIAFDRESGEQYTEYSVDKANAALDAAGLTKRDSKGIRLLDGKALRVTLLVNASVPDHVDALELVKSDWEKVGVAVLIQPVAETLYWERVEANQSECSIWNGGDFEIRATMGSNHCYVPSNPRGSSVWGSKWAEWYRAKGESGEEPPAPLKKSLELFDKMRATYDADQATEIGREILAIAKDQFIYIGVCTPPESYGVVNNAMSNVPDSFPGAAIYTAPGPTHPEQYSLKAEAK